MYAWKQTCLPVYGVCYSNGTYLNANTKYVYQYKVLSNVNEFVIYFQSFMIEFLRMLKSLVLHLRLSKKKTFIQFLSTVNSVSLFLCAKIYTHVQHRSILIVRPNRYLTKYNKHILSPSYLQARF